MQKNALRAAAEGTPIRHAPLTSRRSGHGDAFEFLDQATVDISAVETLLTLLDDLQTARPVPPELRREHDQMTVIIDTVILRVEEVHALMTAAISDLVQRRRAAPGSK